MKQYYIYLTTNLINNNKYIGKHYGELDDDYLGSGKLLTLAINKYGKTNFKKEILYISSSNEENNQKEKEFIKTFNAVERRDFYNIHEGGDGGNTTAGWSEEEKQAYSEKISQKYQGENNPRYGCHLTEETKEKIRQNRDTSYMQTAEYKEAMKLAKSGVKNGMYGKKHSEESKRLMSEHSKGKCAGEKNGMYGKKGDNAINGKKVVMYNLNHEIERIFNSKSAVLEFLGVKGHIGLDKAIKNGDIYKNHYWSVETKETN